MDYIGVVQGIPVCFDAKECVKDTFSLQNIHEHQVKFMEEFEKQGGISFILIYFTGRDEYYYLSYEELQQYWIRMQNGGRKSFRYDELNTKFLFMSGNGVFVPFLEAMQKDLELRD